GHHHHGRAVPRRPGRRTDAPHRVQLVDSHHYPRRRLHRRRRRTAGRHFAADADAAGDSRAGRGVHGHHFPGTDSHVPLQRAELGAPGPGRLADAAAVLGLRYGAEHYFGPDFHYRRGTDSGHGHPRRGLGHAHRPDADGGAGHSLHRSEHGSDLA